MSDLHELAARLRAIGGNSRIVYMNLHAPILAAAAELDRLDNVDEQVDSVTTEAGRLDTLACAYAHETARLREALTWARKFVPEGAAWTIHIDTLLSTDPAQVAAQVAACVGEPQSGSSTRAVVLLREARRILGGVEFDDGETGNDLDVVRQIDALVEELGGPS